MKGKLYVVGTPIGNLGDFSPRAIETLQAVDFIAAEDTRVTLKLLNKFNIKKPMVSYYEHNLRERGEQIIGRMLNGENCAIVSDAGMPCISDPGEDLVKLCAQNDIDTISVPGPSAVVSALSISGLSTSRFSFEGFLSTNKLSRAEHLSSVKHLPNTLIFYEAPHKLLSTLKDMLRVFGDRKISLVKELTKVHENVFRTTFSQAIEYYEENSPKGEFVLIIEGATEKANNDEEMSFDAAVALAKDFIKDGIKTADAAKRAAAVSGYKKSEIYKMIINE